MELGDRQNFLNELDERLLQGGVVLSEWCCLIVRESDLAFTSGAYLATIITALAGIETYLRSEYGNRTKDTLQQLIEKSPLEDELKATLHELRKYRNKWVHVSAPWDDQKLLADPESSARELEVMAMVVVRALRETIYENQFL